MSALDAPITRRRALAVIGGTLVLAEAGLAGLLASCTSAPVPRTWVPTGVKPEALPLGRPVPIPVAVPTLGGAVVRGATWMVRHSDDTIVAFDPHCTHQQCAYAWEQDPGRFTCVCHQATFDIDGKVTAGPPPRPLDRYATRLVDGKLEVEVPQDFATPKPTI